LTHDRCRAQQRLERMGVEVRLNSAVAAVEGDELRFKDGTRLRASTVVWAAGQTDILDVARARGGRGHRRLLLDMLPTLVYNLSNYLDSNRSSDGQATSAWLNQQANQNEPVTPSWHVS
jgi:muramoyltetrapeptide carboxypeptidase LdcA involved in peptidoglycan recycling